MRARYRACNVFARRLSGWITATDISSWSEGWNLELHGSERRLIPNCLSPSCQSIRGRDWRRGLLLLGLTPFLHESRYINVLPPTCMMAKSRRPTSEMSPAVYRQVLRACVVSEFSG
jgi:hypothetical protein